MLQKRYWCIRAKREAKKVEDKEIEELKQRVFDVDEIKKISAIQNSFKKKFARRTQKEKPKET